MILSRIPKKEAHHIFDILDSRTIDSYYIPEQTEESIIQLNPNTRAGVYLLDTLNKIFSSFLNFLKKTLSQILQLILRTKAKQVWHPCITTRHFYFTESFELSIDQFRMVATLLYVPLL